MIPNLAGAFRKGRPSGEGNSTSSITSTPSRCWSRSVVLRRHRDRHESSSDLGRLRPLLLTAAGPLSFLFVLFVLASSPSSSYFFVGGFTLLPLPSCTGAVGGFRSTSLLHRAQKQQHKQIEHKLQSPRLSSSISFPPRSATVPWGGLFLSSSSSSLQSSSSSSSSSASPLAGGNEEEGKEETSGSSDPDGEGDEDEMTGGAVTRTINQRLLDELRELAAEETESSTTRKNSKNKMKKRSREDTNVLLWGGQRKTDEERQKAIEEAKDLNGVDPISTFAGSLFALGVAAALWTLTNSVAEFFASHPPQPTDLYVVQRATAVFRNVVIGMFALASGFFGVTGIGILLLAGRVFIGVAKGELDPKSASAGAGASGGESGDEKSRLLSSAWELMTGGGDPASARRRRSQNIQQKKNDGDGEK